MKTIAWITDLHFDLAKVEAFDKLIADLRKQQSDLIVVSGDIAEEGRCFEQLSKIQKDLKIPLYYVLGNHDFYGSSVEHIRSLAPKYPTIHYLTAGLIIPVDSKTCIIGHDGWADAQAGDYEKSNVLLKDFTEISDFMGFGKHQWKLIMQRWGQESADTVEVTLLKTFETYENVIVITHFPPFRECCLYKNEMSHDDWAPFFVNIAMGKMLIEIMENYPEKNVLVLCGHTHAKAEYSPLENLTVRVAHAEYEKPEAQMPIQVK